MRVLVTGGTGFLGRAVSRRLVESGHTVRALSRSAHQAPPAPGVTPVTGDIRRRADVEAAVRGCDAVVHCAGKAGAWGRRAEYWATNVDGTRNVLAACTRFGVPWLVHTSSPSVVHRGEDLAGADESAPYATRFLAPYPESKTAAERLVLAANAPHLATVALRPHVIWGPGDPHFVPRLVARARAGQLRLIGNAGWLVDNVYLDNAAEAHVLALHRLAEGAAVAGRAYFITQDDPRPIGETINMWLGAAGLPPVTRRIPVRLARRLAGAMELAYRLAPSRAEPPLTRFLVQQLTTAHWFDISAARRDLGYHPTVSTSEGVEALRAHLSRSRPAGKPAA